MYVVLGFTIETYNIDIWGDICIRDSPCSALHSTYWDDQRPMCKLNHALSHEVHLVRVFAQDLRRRDCVPVHLAPGRVPRTGVLRLERTRRASRADFFFRPPALMKRLSRRGLGTWYLVFESSRLVVSAQSVRSCRMPLESTGLL
jgi:hypothetical protein